MANKNLKNLSRSELLEMLLEQRKEVERLTKELEVTKMALANRQIAINSAGSIAEASLKLTKVFEEAQRAANIYLDNIKMIEVEKRRTANKLLDEKIKKLQKNNF